MKALVRRVRHLFLHPATEWQVINDEPAAYPEVLFRYVAILAVLPPAAAVAGRFLINYNISNNALGSSFVYLVFTNLLWYCMYIIDVVIAGIVISAIMTNRESGWNGLQGFRIAAYSFTPLFIAGFIAVLPWMGWIVDVAVLYSIYLLYHGIAALSPTRRSRAMGYTLASFLSAAVIIGVMNLFEYVLESSMTAGMFRDMIK